MENNSNPYKTSAVENKIIKNKFAENLLKIKNLIKINKNIYYLHSECWTTWKETSPVVILQKYQWNEECNISLQNKVVIKYTK